MKHRDSLFFVAGVGLMAYGLSQYSQPLGFILVGLISFVTAIGMSRR